MAYDLIKISGLPLVTPDSGQDIVVGVGDYAKRINYNAVKADMVGTSPSYTTDTEPYLMRQTAHTGVVGKCALNKLVGGSLGWNQLATNFVNRSQILGISITADNVNGKITTSGTASATNNLYFMQGLSVITGHKYLLTGSKGKGTLVIPSFTDRVDSGNGMIFSSGSTSTAAQIAYGFTSGQTYSETLYPQFFDLTQMFGSAIADYVYGLESATAGAGVAWLRKYIDIDSYHAYDAGSIQSVQATAHVTKDANDNVIGNYPLGSDTLRGIPQLVSNKLSYDGDEKYPDGTTKRKYGSRAYQSGDTSDGATMITDGTTTVYKLATPTTESSTAYQKVQTIDADGTESFTTSSPVPVGHETQTPDNILAALEWLGE